MTITTITSREFNQDVGRAKRVAKDGPVFITDRGRLAHVFLTIEDYQAIAGSRRSLADAMAAPGLSNIDFDPPRLDVVSRAADLG